VSYSVGASQISLHGPEFGSAFGHYNGRQRYHGVFMRSHRCISITKLHARSVSGIYSRKLGTSE